VGVPAVSFRVSYVYEKKLSALRPYAVVLLIQQERSDERGPCGDNLVKQIWTEELLNNFLCLYHIGIYYG
jgi:hypothetical protein